jgi:hypothetical protein
MKGVAEIFNEVARVAASRRIAPRLYLNEFNVLQWSHAPGAVRGSSDPCANWYRRHVEELRDAGGAIGGVGVQYYCSMLPRARRLSPHSPKKIHPVMQNLSVTGLPISLTEYATQHATPEEAATILDETMRLVFGTPQATTFMIWGFWAGAVAAKDVSTALVDKDWNLTPAGHAYERLMSRWNTDEALVVGHDGAVRFTGFFGDYELLFDDGRRAHLTLEKGRSDYTVRP